MNPEVEKVLTDAFSKAEGYFEEAINGNTVSYQSAMGGFVFLIDSFNKYGYREVFEEILKLRETSKQGMDSFAYSIETVYNQRIDPNNITVRSFLTGKSVEELKKEDQEAAENKRIQSEEWANKGLCRYCGGQLGFMRKCKSCGTKN
jgi:hypothetical protein